jgi:hypothetical protein
MRRILIFVVYYVWPVVWLLVLLTAFALAAYISEMRP